MVTDVTALPPYSLPSASTEIGGAVAICPLSPDEPISVKVGCDALLCIQHCGIGINLPTLVKKCATHQRLDVTPAMYMRVYRLVKKMETAKLIQILRKDGLIWIVPTHAVYADNPFNLMRAIVKLKPSASAWCSENDVKRHKLWKISQFLLKFKRLNRKGWDILNSNFDGYQEDVSNKWLIFRHKDLPSQYMAHQYTHRFQGDQARKKIMEYNEIWDHPLIKKMKVGVHLTTTFDRSKSLKETNAEISMLFNRLMSWIQKRKTFRPMYIKIIEFQRDGRHHLHIVLYGIGWLANKGKYVWDPDQGKNIYKPGELDIELQKIGFGKISYIYKIVNRNGKWLYARDRPKDAKSDDCQNHLKKYLEKCLEEDHYKIAMYWLTNKRFFTNTRALLASHPMLDLPACWAYVGCWDIMRIPDIIYKNIIEWLPADKGPPIVT